MKSEKSKEKIEKIPASSAFLNSKSRSLRPWPCCWSTSSTRDAAENDTDASDSITGSSSEKNHSNHKRE